MVRQQTQKVAACAASSAFLPARQVRNERSAEETGNTREVQQSTAPQLKGSPARRQHGTETRKARAVYASCAAGACQCYVSPGVQLMEGTAENARRKMQKNNTGRNIAQAAT